MYIDNKKLHSFTVESESEISIYLKNLADSRKIVSWTTTHL